LGVQGQVLSDQQIKDFRAEANNYATTKSVTQVIFTTSAIASNVTLWNQVGSRGLPRGMRTMRMAVASGSCYNVCYLKLVLHLPRVRGAHAVTSDCLQLDHNAARFGALSALIWISVALNAFVILLATYLSFQVVQVQHALLLTLMRFARSHISAA
jgi:hypothetical protein